MFMKINFTESEMNNQVHVDYKFSHSTKGDGVLRQNNGSTFITFRPLFLLPVEILARVLSCNCLCFA